MSSDYSEVFDEEPDLESAPEAVALEDKFEEISPEFYSEEREGELSEEELIDDDLDELSQDFVNRIIDKIMQFMVVMVGHDLHVYQKPLARRIIESVIINDGEEITALAARQSGKDLDIATPILTANRGWTTMGWMVEGDVVFAPDGSPTGVTLAHPIEMAPYGAYKVTLTDGRSLIAGGEHLWEVYGYGVTKQVLTTHQLLEQGLYRERTVVTSGKEYSTREYRWRIPEQSAITQGLSAKLPIDPYYLGAWLGDGHSYSTFTTSHRDDVPSMLSNVPYECWEVQYAKECSPNTATLKFRDSGSEESLSKQLWALGVLKNRSTEPNEKHIPDSYLAADYASRLALLQGLMDTDGGVTDTHTASRVEYTSVKRRLAEDVHTLALSLGYRATLIEGIAKLNGREIGPKYRVCFSIYEGDPTPFRLQRKIDGIKLATWKKRASIKSIEKVEDRLTRCITVDREDGMFLAGRELVPTHNSETVADTISVLMVILPLLAKLYPDLLGRFKGGLWVGMFAPTESQVETLFSRTVTRLTSEHALAVLEDPEIDESIARVGGVTKMIRLKKSGSTLTMMTANPRAKIESKSFHLIVIDECQSADDFVVSKSISPMLAYYAGTMVKTGTPTTSKNNFHKAIQQNKRRATTRGARKNHFQWDWRDVAKINPSYAKFIKKEMLRIGEDSDEFQLSYNCKWLLERGMFVTQSIMDELGDTSQELVKSWHKTPVVVGIDPARKMDSTVVTVVWVDWDRPDEFGYFDHRVLNWLEIQGDDWEEQYFQIVNFLSNYDVLAVGIDANGVGDAVAQRLKILMPRAEVIPLTSSPSEQSKRFKHLQALIQRRMLSFPAHAKTRRLRIWKRFMQQMVDAEVVYKGPNFGVAAPDEAYAHDDFVDALAIAASMTVDLVMPEVQVSSNVFF